MRSLHLLYTYLGAPPLSMFFFSCNLSKTYSMDSETNWQQHTEADAFFCFTNLMSEIRDHFLLSLDNAEGGIKSKVKRQQYHMLSLA